MLIQRVRGSVRRRGHTALMAAYGRGVISLTRRSRTSRWRGLQLTVPPGVFHPGLYFSSRALADELLASVPLAGRSLLDVGTGSGFLALVGASSGATATAVDINPLAVRTAKANAHHNGLGVEVLCSDLFAAVAGRRFDVVVVNPPYFRCDPANDTEHAWFAGADLGYFERFFASLGTHIHARSTVLMVLGEDCELDTVERIAHRHGFEVLVQRRRRHALTASNVFTVTRRT